MRNTLGLYLGQNRAAWRTYDSVALIEDGHRVPQMLIDQGENDPYLATQLRPELLAAVCQTHGIDCQLRTHAGYDHSYDFTASFIEDHLPWHGARLQR